MGANAVFISYSHDSSEHSARVLDLANALRSMGVDVELDQFEVRPIRGWPQWCEECLRPENTKFVLVICTLVYRDRVENKIKADEGRGVFWEGSIIYQYLYDDKGNKRFIPVLLGDAPEDGIPLPLKGHARYSVKAFDLSDPEFEGLYRELTGQPAIIKQLLGERVILPPRQPAAPIVAAPLPSRPAQSSFPPAEAKKLQKRANDFVVSYDPGDLARVTPLTNLLRKICGLGIGFDGVGGMQSSAGAIGNARGAIFCLSEAWKGSVSCRKEYELSKLEKDAQDGFEIVCLRLDDVDTDGLLDVAEIIDLRQVCRQSIARLLCSLSSDAPLRFDNDEDVYLAAPWSRQSDLVSETLKALGQTGWRLVGDNPDLKYFRDSEARIEAIQRSSRGVVALLPYDSSQLGAATSPYILAEARMALGLGRRLLLLSEPRVGLGEDLLRGAFRVVTLDPQDREAVDRALGDFDAELGHVAHDDTGAFIFFAGSLLDDPSDADDVASVIERASNMRCIRGERLSAQNVQEAIIDRIRRAAVVIADVSDDHRNTLIETGIAMGCGTQLKLMCRAPPDGVPPKKPFMLEGRELYLYQTPVERLGLCFYFARQFRRRVYAIH